MATTIRFRRRAAGGAAGAPSSLQNAEPAFNEADGVLYIGRGTGGAGGTATDIIAIGGPGAFMSLTGDQTVAGAKTFSGTVIVPAPTAANHAATRQFVLDQVGAAGGGDMMVSTYDTNADGKVNAADAADSVPWSGVTGKPTTFTPAAHTHVVADITDFGTTIANYAPLASPTFTGTPAAPTATAGTNTTQIATTGYVYSAVRALDAGWLTSGVIDPARLPVLPGSNSVISSGGIANLTAGEQNDVAQGTIVTTTDGRRWVYTGTGSKTAEASYIELADTTPEWSVIANKPAFHAVATSGSYTDLSGRPTLATVATSGNYTDLTNRPALATVATSGSYTDLTNRPTLGTMAAQDASAVAITGGTIDGVTMDGGTF